LRRFMASGFKLPAAPQDVINYLVEHCKALNPRTLQRHLHSLKFAHKINNYVDPTADKRVEQVLKGIFNTFGKPPKRAPPFTIEHMRAINSFYVEQHDNPCCPLKHPLRDNALLQLGFFGAFRRTEVVKIKFEHIEWKDEGIIILLPRSKGDQKAEGQSVAIPKVRGDLCPVSVLKQWLDESKIKSGYVFPNEYGSHIGDHRFYIVVKDGAKAIGLPKWNDYSGHSLRRGFATEAAKRGASLLAIQRQGRWVNIDTMAKYIEEGNCFNQNAGSVFDIS